MHTIESASSFDKYWQIIQRRWYPSLGIFFPVIFITLLFSHFQKPAYEAEGKLMFQRSNTISTMTGVAPELGKLEAVTQDDKTNPLNTEAEIIRSIPLVQKTIIELDLKNELGLPLKPREFLKNLTVKDIKGADVIQISYRDRDPKIAAEVVNTVMQAYLDYNVSSRRKEAAAARKFITMQLPTAESIVSNAEAELARFKEKNKVVSLQEEASKSIELVTDFQRQIGESQSQIADINSQSESLRQQLNMTSQQAVAATNVSQTAGVQDILKEVQQLESQLAARRTVLQDDHPEIISLVNKQKALKAILNQRVKQAVGTTSTQDNSNLQNGALKQQLAGDLVKLESTRLGLMSKVTALSNLQSAYKQRLNLLPRLEQQQRQLERKVQASQNTYSLLLQKLQESRIAENQNVGNASLVSEAQVPDQPVSSPLIAYITAGLLATLAAIATMYILEARDKSIKTIDEAKELIGFTLLGVIPFFNESKTYIHRHEGLEIYPSRLVVRDYPRSAISEAYRMLRANLKFMSADKELKIIVVTSSIPGEGKSTVAANLALAMAQMERQVLLIDADLHCPVQHKIWEITNSQGLSHVIIGQAESRTAIKQVTDNLDVLTAGVVPPSPASLLDSKRMASLMETFAVKYDFVIIDAPALNVAADAATLGQIADGVLFIVRPGVVDSVHAAIACEILEKSGQNVLGQVINGVIPKNESHSYYYFNQESHQQEYSVAR
ncbi:polysaccharide biosynthesis tyrosine autokinase [Calothrix sp. FACHB-156]|nr:polysaccharide biosynthesis tyrosine autokinase [Calothrix sp. FACHB-156]